MGISTAAGRFIGRRDDLARLHASFAAGDRLVTVMGPGGIGKTRLALEFATTSPSTWFCDLADARSLDDICFAVATALELPGPAPRGPREIGRALAARGPTLLVLDNFEQLIAHAEKSAGAWLRDAPSLRVLVTSRVRLGLASEVTLDLPPLSVPRDDASAADSEAVQLFLDRMRAHDGGFTADADGLRAIATIARRLDGIPLAIELGVARIDVLGLDGLLARLPKALDVLGRRGKKVPARQATLRGAIEWSWALLGDEAQRALAQCAMFRGGFGVDAAEAVLQLGSDAGGVAVLDALQSLRDHSLIRSTSTPSEGVRFTLFDTIRDFALEKLEKSRQSERSFDRHLEYYAALAQRIALDSDTSVAPVPRRAMLERDNLTAAWEHALRTTRTAAEQERALHLALGLDAVLAQQGAPSARIALLDRALEIATSRTVDSTLRARVRRARGRAHFAAGDLALAERDYRAALVAVDRPARTALRGSMLLDMGVLHHARREIAKARRCYEEALTIHRALGPRAAEGRTLGNLGALHHDVGEFDDARRHYVRALGIFHDAGDLRLEGIFLTNLGILDAEVGHADDAQSRYERALRILSLADDGRLLAITEGNFGTLLHERGDLDGARMRHERALRGLRSAGDVRSEALCLARLGATVAEMGHGDDARALLDESEFRIEQVDDAIGRQLLRLARTLLDLSPGRNRPAGDDAKRLSAVRDEVTNARRPGPGNAPSSAALSDDVRAMLRIVERALARVDPVHDAVATVPENAFAVGPDAAWFRAPNGRWQDLRRYGTLRMLLGALIAQHDRRGGPLSLSALQEAAWPGQKLRPDAGAHRVYVALSTLRTRGLARWLVRETDGYQLDPSLVVHRVDALPKMAPARRPRRSR